MFPRRFTYVLASAVLVSVGLAWIAVESASERLHVGHLAEGESYAIDGPSDERTIDLDFRSGSRYALIVSSLGYSGSEHAVTFAAEPTHKVGHLPARRLKPLPRRRFRTRHASAVVPVSVDSSRQQASSDELDASAPAAAAGAGRRDFFLHVTDGPLDDPKQYARVTGRLVAEGRHVRIYLDSQQTEKELCRGVLTEMVRLFDTVIVPRFEADLGRYRDVDADGKFTVLLSPWLNKLQGGGTSLGGFVRGTDFRYDVERPLGNRCDMLYLNSNVRPGPHLQTLLAHEYAHVVAFSERMPSSENRSGLPDEDDWLNEAIAHVAENRFGIGWSNLDYRVSRYLNEPQSFPLVVNDYYHAGLWRSHGCRGATYLFLRWNVDQFGGDLLKRLIQSPVNGTRNLEWATGVKFEELYRRWSIALYQSGRERPAFSNAGSLPNRGESKRLQAPTRAAGSVSLSHAASRGDGFTSIDLRGRMAGWGLAGPRPVEWNVDGGSKSLKLKGTSTAFLELEASGSGGVRRIHLQADYGTRLQVSVIKLADDQPQLRVAAGWNNASETRTASRETASDQSRATRTSRSLNVAIVGSNDPNLRIEMIACEQNLGTTRNSVCFSGKDLLECRQTMRRTDSRANRQVFQLPFSVDTNSKAMCVVKVVARDDQGRRTVAWATLSQGDATGGPQQIAESVLRHMR